MHERFRCDACHELRPLDVWCSEGENGEALLCRRCCPCPVHWGDDPGGRAVFSGAPLRWQGLTARERHACP